MLLSNPITLPSPSYSLSTLVGFRISTVSTMTGPPGTRIVEWIFYAL
jgi:hypothetical protein